MSVFALEMECFTWALTAPVREHHRVKPVPKLDSHDWLHNNGKAVVIPCHPDALKFLEWRLVLMKDVFDKIHIVTHCNVDDLV